MPQLRPMARRAALAVSLVLALGAAFVPLPSQRLAAQEAAAPARTEAELRAALDGAWFLATPEPTGRQRIEQAIERAVSEMNFFLQGITRDQLREKTPLNRRIDLGFHPDGRITVGFDQRYSYTTRPGIAQPFTLPDGAEVQVTQHFRGAVLEQYFGHSLGQRWNNYALSPDGQTMTVTATQQGPMMPVPVHFTLEYRKRS